MLCRALEASAEENAARIKRKRCEAQSEMCSPAEWIRQEDWPVGIRNVGNTCWFSAVIQVRTRSFFHLINNKMKKEHFGYGGQINNNKCP